MRAGLVPGSRGVFRLTVGERHTVPALYPESPAFRAMPRVLATGYMVGLMEWACLEQLAPFMEEGEGSLGTHIDVSHASPTPPGLTVTVETEVEAVAGRCIWFRLRAHDGVDAIGAGRHQRVVVRWDRFVPKAMAKAAARADAADGVRA
jgi:fluoroacetyl-CoA thioesterase